MNKLSLQSSKHSLTKVNAYQEQVMEEEDEREEEQENIVSENKHLTKYLFMSSN